MKSVDDIYYETRVITALTIAGFIMTVFNTLLVFIYIFYIFPVTEGRVNP